MNKYYQNCLSCLKGLYFLGKSKLQKFIRNRKRKNDLFSKTFPINLWKMLPKRFRANIKM